MLPTLDEIGRRRRLLAMSQKQLAHLAGVSQSMIAKVESKRISPSYLKTKAIFDTLEGLERKNEFKANQEPLYCGCRLALNSFALQLKIALS